MTGDRTTFENSGTVNMPGGIIGNHNRSTAGAPAPHTAEKPEPSCEIGVLTVTPVETAAVREVLGLTPHPEHAGVLVGNRDARIVSMQLSKQGLESAATAAAGLAHEFRPPFIVLTGIGGGINKNVRIADVVIATRVVAYDLRKETPNGVQRRTCEFAAPPKAHYAVEDLFAERGDPLTLQEFQVRHAPIGSGNAVVADRKSRIVKDLRRYNDKILAVDMESAGLANYCDANRAVGWVVVRGISDDASRHKDDTRQAEAARNAALTLRELIPYLTRHL